MADHTKINEMLQAAQQRITRLSPEAAAEAQRAGAIFIDTRDSADRTAEGVIPGSVRAHRNVLEWRADPDAELPDARIADRSLQLIVVCNDGYSSSLAAASLLELGFERAGDLVGGYRAWKAAGLPTEAPEE
jgi:rhodanese-related sulfurtransferase